MCDYVVFRPKKKKKSQLEKSERLREKKKKKTVEEVNYLTGSPCMW